MPLPPALAARLAKRGILKVSHVFFSFLAVGFSASCSVVHPDHGIMLNSNPVERENQIVILQSFLNAIIFFLDFH